MNPFFLLLLPFLFVTSTFAQNSTGINNSKPNPKAALDIVSIGKQGILIPRHSVSNPIDTISFSLSPKDAGLTIYDTLNAKFWYWTGARWESFGKASAAPSTSYWTSAATNRIRTSDQNDYVGIGTLAPTKWLTVSNTATLTSSADIGIIAGTSGTATLFFGNTSNNNLGAVRYDNVSNSLNFWTNNTANRLIINNAGKIGLGINSGFANLQIHDANNNSELHLTTTSTGSTSTDGFRMALNSAAMNLLLYEAMDINIGTNKVNVMTITSAGNVGIGTGLPTQTLSVDGTAGKTGGGAWAGFSDRRVKKNVATFSDGLDKLMKIRPVSFQYNNKSGYSDTSSTYIGVIAQEIKKILPYTVKTSSNGIIQDLLEYESTALLYVLINSVQEQQRTIEGLEKETKRLQGLLNKSKDKGVEARMAELENDNQELKKQLREIRNILEGSASSR